MSKTYVKAFDGYILGSIEDDPYRKERKAFDFYGRILGTYDTKLDVTRDFGGRIVAQGDALTSLIYEEAAKQEAEKASHITGNKK
jgi:hypothetical protein